MREQFAEAFDRLMHCRIVLENLKKTAEDCLEPAQPILKLIHLGRLKADGETMRDIEIGVKRVESDKRNAIKCMDDAEKKADSCSSIISRLELYSRTPTSNEEIRRWEDKFQEELWFLNASIEEVQALRAQIEGSAASLDKSLPL